MKHSIAKPVIDPAKVEAMTQNGLTSEDVGRYLPQYLYKPDPLWCGPVKYWWLTFIQTFIIFFVKLALRPRDGKVGDLGIAEVEKVYDREARSYDAKHHYTTRGMDTTWRRWAAQCVASFARGRKGTIRVLDLCTGTGLTIVELVKVALDWGLKLDIGGLDYNLNMLQVARSRKLDCDGTQVRYTRGNAMDLVFPKGQERISCIGTGSTDTRLDPESVDAVTQVFGIGGISDAVKVFEGVLQILRPDGRFFMVDMHQPVSGQECEMPLLWKWIRLPRWEAMAYNNNTMEVVLKRLWGWRDPTLYFYQLPLVTFQDDAGNWWGFETIIFEMNSQRWWLGMPVMPIAKIAVQKVKIGQEEALRRQKVLSALQ